MPDEMNEILQRLTRVETKIDMMMTARDIANEALQSSKSAHHRLDEIRDNELPTLRDQMKEMRANQKWLIGTTISVVGLFLTAIGILLRISLH